MTLLNEYLRQRFGCKVYKVAINAGFTCPNRDGTLGTGGCIFCSAGGSGEFAGDHVSGVTEQIELGKMRVSKKIHDGKYIAYFQSYTGTYAPVDRLEALYSEAIGHPDVAALSVATRPDCLPPDVVSLLSRLNVTKPVWVELGLQTIHERTAQYIRRGYGLAVYDRAAALLRREGMEVITHVILGLPGESREDMKETVRHCCEAGTTGIKLRYVMILGMDSDQFKWFKKNLIVGHCRMRLYVLFCGKFSDLSIWGPKGAGSDIQAQEVWADYPNPNRPLDFVISSKDKKSVYAVGLARYDGDRGGAQEDDRTGGYKNCTDEILAYVHEHDLKTKIIYLNDGPGLLLGSMWRDYSDLEDRFPGEVKVITLRMIDERLSKEWLIGGD